MKSNLKRFVIVTLVTILMSFSVFADNGSNQEEGSVWSYFSFLLKPSKDGAIRL